MSRIRPLAAALAAVTLCITLTAASAPTPGLEGWNRGQSYDRLYDPNYEVYVPSRVVRIESFVPQPGMAAGVRAFVDAGRESLWVHLGPEVFMAAQKLQLVAGDSVVIVGALVRLEDRHTILAARVEKAGQTMKLRDSNGDPAWSRFHPR